MGFGIGFELITANECFYGFLVNGWGSRSSIAIRYVERFSSTSDKGLVLD